MLDRFRPLPSTRAFFAAARATPGMGLLEALHGYVYARWPYLYIGVAKGDHWLARAFVQAQGGWHRLTGRAPDPARAEAFGRAFADGYHGKAMPVEAAARLIDVRREISASLPEAVLPYAKAREVILSGGDALVALDCPCRSVAKSPCSPLDVCLIVGDPIASFVAEHHPTRSRRITPDEALAILQAEDERGHVHHAFFKDAMLGRFYAVCNCCACCCGAIQAHKNGVPMLASSGYVCAVDEDACLGCGQCDGVCPFGALTGDDGQARVDAALCLGCGVCAARCPNGALSLKRDPARGEPLRVA